MKSNTPQNTTPVIKHHGATIGVTGSCHELEFSPNKSVLIDCGIFQGKDRSPSGEAHADNLEIDFSIENVEAMILTHCHIDHAGRIPWLIAAGFDKPIYCSEPTAKLLPIMLRDAAYLGITKDNRLLDKLINRVKSLLKPIKYNTKTPIADNLDIYLQRAGHILGSAYVECDTSEQRIIFSGDLGAPHAPLLPEPESPKYCDTLVIESTYGDKCHEERASRRNRLEEVLKRCLDNDGVILVPAFSLGRTQELLYEIEHLIHKNGEPWNCLNVVLDSPLARKVTSVYRDLRPFWDNEAQEILDNHRYPLTFKQLHEVETHREHVKFVEKLKQDPCPTIIIAASGMCNGGRITSYLLEYIEDPKTDIVFTGYQARGSVGRIIQKYAEKNGWVELKHQRKTINAAVHTIGGYSAHADQQNLIDFACEMDKPPTIIRIIHGDKKAKKKLAKKYAKRLPECEILIPEH